MAILSLLDSKNKRKREWRGGWIEEDMRCI